MGMKKYLAAILIMCSLIINFQKPGFAQKPDYEKYGRIAMAVIKEDFPGEPVRDYEYLGRKKINDMKVEDGFRFKVQEKIRFSL